MMQNTFASFCNTKNLHNVAPCFLDKLSYTAHCKRQHKLNSSKRDKKNTAKHRHLKLNKKQKYEREQEKQSKYIVKLIWSHTLFL